MTKNITSGSKLDKINVEPFTWCTKVAEGIISNMPASDFIKNAFKTNIDFEAMFYEAIQIICAYIGETVREEFKSTFIQEYISDCNLIIRQLKIYAETSDKEIIFLAQNNASKVVKHFLPYKVEELGVLVIACSLHLLSLKAISEIPEETGFKKITEDTCKEYANLLEEISNIYLKKIKSLVTSKCDNAWRFSRGILPPPPPPPPPEEHYTFTADGKTYNYDDLNKCEHDRQVKFDELLSQRRNPYDKCQIIINAYRTFKIKN